jgi:hypothetical protein
LAAGTLEVSESLCCPNNPDLSRDVDVPKPAITAMLPPAKRAYEVWGGREGEGRGVVGLGSRERRREEERRCWVWCRSAEAEGLRV